MDVYKLSSLFWSVGHTGKVWPELVVRILVHMQIRYKCKFGESVVVDAHYCFTKPLGSQILFSQFFDILVLVIVLPCFRF